MWRHRGKIYIAKKNGEPLENSPGYVAPSTTDGPQITVERNSKIENSMEMHVSNFWPLQDVEETLKFEPQAESIVSGNDRCGRECNGIHRHPSIDVPVAELPRRVALMYRKERG